MLLIKIVVLVYHVHCMAAFQPVSSFLISFSDFTCISYISIIIWFKIKSRKDKTMQVLNYYKHRLDRKRDDDVNISARMTSSWNHLTQILDLSSLN